MMKVVNSNEFKSEIEKDMVLVVFLQNGVDLAK